MLIREARPEEFEALGQVMFQAVRTGESPYTAAQRAAWAPAPRGGPEWKARLQTQEIFVAEVDGAVAGFMTLAAGGHIDLAYILPAYRGAGLFRELYERLEARALAQGQSRLWVHASLMAAPAFARVGFESAGEEDVEIGGERLRRHVMAKSLPIGA